MGYPLLTIKLPKLIHDIIDNIQIELSELSVCHSAYQLKKYTLGNIEQIRKLPKDIQDKYLITTIRNIILDIYFNGSLILDKNRSLDKNDKKKLNNTSFQVDWEFYEGLEKNNQGKGWWNHNYQIIKEETDGSLQVKKKNITITIQREYHLHPEQRSATVGDIVSVYNLHSRLIKDFYMAYGDIVRYADEPFISIYFNFSSQGALVFMKELTEKLNLKQIPFCFYVLYNPDRYGRYDSGILQIRKNYYNVVRSLLEILYTKNRSEFNHQIPILSKYIAPGIGLAEKPEKEFTFQEGFGVNRCTIIAQALVEAHNNGDNSPELRMEYVLKHFANFGIDIECPYLNPNSEDIYSSLAL